MKNNSEQLEEVKKVRVIKSKEFFFDYDYNIFEITVSTLKEIKSIARQLNKPLIFHKFPSKEECYMVIDKISRYTFISKEGTKPRENERKQNYHG